MRNKKCKVCKTVFQPIRPLQMVCSPTCGYEYAKMQKQKSWNKEKKERKEKLMTRSDWMNLAQKTFNAYIRERDKDRRCISCGTYNGKMNAGHYMSVGSTPELRFNEDNVQKQCEKCNSYLSGNLVNYRIELIQRIGLKRVEALEQKNHPPLKMTVDEIKDLIKIYKEKTKALKCH
jgi:hypothetical protein